MRQIQEALDEVDAWAQDQSTQVTQELEEVRNQLVGITAELERLEAERVRLTSIEGTLVGRTAGLLGDRLQRSHEALFAVLTSQAQALGARQAEVDAVLARRLEELESELDGSDMAPLKEEYEQFVQTVEPNLQSLPESYRSAVVEHHQRITTQLADHLREAAGLPVALTSEALPVEVIYAVDAPEGEEELLVVVLPVSDRVVLRWHEQADGLQTWLAARAVQAIYEAAKEAAFPAAQATSGAHQGLMAIEVELFDAPHGFVAAFEERLSALFSTAEELLAARITVSPRRIDVDVVLPPEADVAETPGRAPRQGEPESHTEDAHAG